MFLHSVVCIFVPGHFLPCVFLACALLFFGFLREQTSDLTLAWGNLPKNSGHTTSYSFIYIYNFGDRKPLNLYANMLAPENTLMKVFSSCHTVSQKRKYKRQKGDAPLNAANFFLKHYSNLYQQDWSGNLANQVFFHWAEAL